MSFILLLLCAVASALDAAHRARHETHGHMRGTDKDNPGDDELTGKLLDKYVDEFPAKERRDAPDPSSCSLHNVSGTGNASEPRRTVVVAKYDEDVGWLKCLPQNVDTVVYQSKDENSPRFVENVGNEASKYLSYIVENYNELPDSVMFMQAGRQDWHDPEPKDVLLQRWNWDNAQDHGGMAFLPTSAPCLVEDSVQVPLEEDIRTEPVVAAAMNDGECINVKEHSPPQMDTVRKVWDDVFSSTLGPLPQRWITHCCAQFEVTREAIHQHPASFYQSLLDWTMQHDKGLQAADFSKQMKRNHDALRQDAGHVMEVTWALIFSNRAVLPATTSS